MNLQSVEKRVVADTLDVVSVFYTIQGEGPWSGVPCVFIRLGGCNLQCTLCDTDYSSNRMKTTVENVVNAVRRLPGNRVVLTGGEPFRQAKSFDLLKHLLHSGYRCQVETNGVLGLDQVGELSNLVIVCSPKTSEVNKSLIPFITDYKYVVQCGEVGEDGLPNVSPINGKALKLFRPEKLDKEHIFIAPWDTGDSKKNQLNLETAMEVCLTHGYHLSLQLQKICGLP